MRYSAAICSLIIGCGSSSARPPEAKIEDVAGLRPERMFAVFDKENPGRTLFGSFSGAVDPGLTLTVLSMDEEELARGEGDADGRIAFDFLSPVDERVLLKSEGNEDLIFRVRTFDRALAKVVAPSLGGAGMTPNDLIISGGEDAHGILVRSGDNAVNAISLTEGIDEKKPGVRLPQIDGAMEPVPANPWSAVPLDEVGYRVAVTAQKQRHVYIVDLLAGALERTLEVQDEVELPTPHTLARPFDIDGDGNQDGEVLRYVPRAPQALAVLDGMLHVGFGGLVVAASSDRPAVWVPPVLVSWRLDALDAKPTMAALPALNLQELRAHEDKLLITCTGAFDLVGGTPVPASDGAVYLFDPGTSRIERAFNLGRFSPGTALIVDGKLWVGLGTQGRLLKIDLNDETNVEPFDITDEEVDTIFRLVELDGGLIGVPSFNTDRLYILDAIKERVSPPPFYEAIQVGSGRPIFDGLQIVAKRPGRRGVDFVGPDLFALSGIASTITPLELRKILGP